MEKQSVVVKRNDYPGGVWDRCNILSASRVAPSSPLPPAPPPSPPENIEEMSLKSEIRFNNLINYACHEHVMDDKEKKALISKDWEKLSGEEKWNKYCEYLSNKIKEDIKYRESEVDAKFSHNTDEKNKWLKIMLEEEKEFKVPDSHLLMHEIFKLKEEIEYLKYERIQTLRLLGDTRKLYFKQIANN